MTLIEQLLRAGVVGAGGGGFPAHVKFAARAEIVIGNGAECEPLLHKDAAVIEHRAREVVRGMELVMDAVGAREGVLGVKEKKKAVVAAAQEACAGSRVRVHLLGDYYPAGDEYDLVFAVTGRLIPPQGLPLAGRRRGQQRGNPRPDRGGGRGPARHPQDGDDRGSGGHSFDLRSPSRRELPRSHRRRRGRHVRRSRPADRRA